MSRPNIVFVLTDDHAAHAISAYGSRINHTPNIDRLADEGVRLDSVYCTNAICSPSRASILTGTYSHLNGVASIWTEIDHRLPTFVDVLHDRGYQTALFGKWHLGESEQAQPRGFDTWKILPGQGEYVDAEMYGPDGREVVEGYVTDRLTDFALDWITERDPDRPFCLLLHHKAPHRPWVPHARHGGMYDDGEIPEPETFFDDHLTRSKAVQGVRMSIADHMGAEDVKEPVPENLRGPENRKERMRWKYQRYMRDYLQVVQAVDDSVGRVLDHLGDHGLADDTLVVYSSDQGFFLGDHGWFDKRLMFDPSLQMPLLMRLPGVIDPGISRDETVTNVDFAATLLDLAGVDPTTALPTGQGRSFVPVIIGETPQDWPDAAYYRYWEHADPIHHAPGHYGIRTKEFKLIYYYGASLGVPGAGDVVTEPEWELYDLRVDPAEFVNVADDPAYTEIRAELEQKLADYQAHYDDRPYVGPDTELPDWGPYDAEQIAATAAHFEEVEASA